MRPAGRWGPDPSPATGPGRRRRVALAVPDKGKELRAGLFTLAEGATHCRGDHGAARLLDPAHGHTQVLGFERHGNPFRVQALEDAVGDLAGEALLHLRSPRE